MKAILIILLVLVSRTTYLQTYSDNGISGYENICTDPFLDLSNQTLTSKNDFTLTMVPCNVHPLVLHYCESFHRKLVKIIIVDFEQGVKIGCIKYILKNSTETIDTLSGFKLDFEKGVFID